MPSTEALLAAALVAVYLIDSMQFLRIGEALVLTRASSLSALSFGGSFELGGRRPNLPNPLTPFRPAFRVEWDTSSGPTADARTVAEEMREHLRHVRFVGWLTTPCAIAIVLVAPVALALGEQMAFLLSVATAWALALGGCIRVAVRRRELGLSTRQVCALVFVALICLPCSPNLARAVTLQRRWTLAARDLPELGFSSEEALRARSQVLDALASAKRYVSEDSPEFKVIDEQLRQLESCGS